MEGMTVKTVCPRCGSDKKKTAKTVVLEGTTVIEGVQEGKITERGMFDGVDAFFLSDRWFTYDKYKTETEINLSSITGLAKEVREAMVEFDKQLEKPIEPHYPRDPVKPGILSPPSPFNPEYKTVAITPPSKPWTTKSPEEIKKTKPIFHEPKKRIWLNVFNEQLVRIVLFALVIGSVNYAFNPQLIFDTYRNPPFGISTLEICGGLLVFLIVLAAIFTSPARFYRKDLRRAEKKFERELGRYYVKLNYAKERWNVYNKKLEEYKEMEMKNSEVQERWNRDSVNANEIHKDWM
ncbi:hypothetical protein ACFL3Y_01035, partial [Pseudomonadota bacterium]